MTEVVSNTPVTPISTAGDNPPVPSVLISTAEPSVSVTPVTTQPITSNQHLKLPNMQAAKASGAFSFSLETPSLSSGTLDKYLKSMLGNDSSHALPEILKPSIPVESTLLSPHNPFSSASSDKLPSLMHDGIPICKSDSDSAPKKEDEAEPMEAEPSNQLATTGDRGGEVIPIPRGQQYVDITEYLNMPQSDAAKKLGIPPSTLSKRWKEAVRKRKWPYRMICKIDKEIMTLLHNVPQGPNAPPLPEEIETALGQLLRRRQEELKPVVIRI